MSEFSDVAVVVPCLNEEAAIAAVVRDMLESLPGCTVYVYDNGSTDRTREVARLAGAVVRSESRPGKGNVVRRMFADISASVFVMCDGDDTYEGAAAPAMVRMLRDENLDLVTGKRITADDSVGSYRAGHQLGNVLFTASVRRLFSSHCEDVLSGYRVMSRRFVKSFPSMAKAFEIEVEITAHASLLRVPTAEYPTQYRARPVGSASKLNTYIDGLRIARALFRIFRSYAPSRFFGTLSGLSGIAGVVLLSLGLNEHSDGVTTTVTAGGLAVVLAVLLLSVGVILNAVARQRVEALRLAYLSLTI